ncbi:pR35 [rat cytomegalovirus strain Maastricht]|uniref:PR35 n=1 Tax=Rat cytomegalovirus (strain Maastricht) TaxID=79700 RepID=Q9DWF6_RCMVM|nr:pR35 [rat cytomegalovirus strain Maastricht]AAF99133.1 pR35 [rat cytomegalovirus strain Maastricht]WEG71959.1 tegument protein UL35 [Murid betaherpesvirus 2]
MEEAPASDDPRYRTSLFIDARHNFPERFLSPDDLDLILAALTDGDAGVVAALNAGLPMAPYMFEALCNPRVRHRFVKVRQLLEPVISFAVGAAHYYNGKRVLEEATNRRARMFGPPDIQRLDIGLRRIYRAARSDDNPYDLMEAVEDLDLPKGAYEKHLRTLYDLLQRVNVDLAATSGLDYQRLSTFNYLFDAPRFLTQEAIETYADNLADITRRDATRPLRSLTVFKRSKDVEDVANDIMFSLALGNAIVQQQAALIAMRKSLLLKLSRLCELSYVAYTQVPETKAVFADLARETHRLVTSTSEEPPDFGPPVATLLRFVRALMDADVYVCPEYVTGQIFAINSRMYDLDSALAGYDHELEIEGDPSGPYDQIRYYAINPYTDSRLFKCPKDLLGHLGDGLIRTRMVQSLITEATDTAVTYDNYELDAVNGLILEGAARSLKISLEQLRHYMEAVPDGAGAAVVADGEEDADLFADVEVRRPAPTRPARGSRFANLKGAKPYSATGRRRGAVEGTRETSL